MKEGRSLLPTWYDLIAPIFDWAIRGIYLPYRRLAMQALELRPGLTVLDLGCGSGLNFELILAQIGPRGTLIGVDLSAEMLRGAQRKVDDHGWTNVRLLRQDVRLLERSDIQGLIGEDHQVDRVVCTLGLTVFPDWETVLAGSFDLLAKGGRYCVMDLHNDQANVYTRLINVLARSEIARRVWEPLQARSIDYRQESHPLMHGSGTIIVASGAAPG